MVVIPLTGLASFYIVIMGGGRNNYGICRLQNGK